MSKITRRTAIRNRSHSHVLLTLETNFQWFYSCRFLITRLLLFINFFTLFACSPVQQAIEFYASLVYKYTHTAYNHFRFFFHYPETIEHFTATDYTEYKKGNMNHGENNLLHNRNAYYCVNKKI